MMTGRPDDLCGERALGTRPDETPYGRYSIRAMQRGKTWQARAFRGGATAGDIEAGTTREAAITAVRTKLDQTAADALASRGEDGFPVAAEVAGALRAILGRLSDSQRAMLRAHLGAPDHVRTATQLAEAVGYASYESVNLRYGKVGRLLAEEMGWTPPARITGGKEPNWTFTLAVGAEPNGSDAPHGGDAPDTAPGHAHWRWRLRPQVAEALARIPL